MHHAVVSLPALLTDNYIKNGYESKQHHKNNGDIKDQALNATTRLEDRARTAATKDAAQAGTTRL